MSTSFKKIKNVQLVRTPMNVVKAKLKKNNHSQIFTRNDSSSSKSVKRWSIISPAFTLHSPRSERTKPTRNNQILSQNHNGEVVVIQNSYTKSFIDAMEESSKTVQLKQHVTSYKESDKEKSTVENNTEEQITVIENDCENDYSLLIKSLNIQN
jgi:hypothetical protein